MEEYFASIQKLVPQIIAAAIGFILLYICKYVAKKLVNKYGNVTQKSPLRMRQVKKLIYILLNILFIFLFILIWGVRPQNLLLTVSSVFAVLGVALFAQWSILSNVTAGIIMFFSAPYRIGDTIIIIDKDTPIEAVIENIGSFYIRIRTGDGQVIVISNNIFLQKIVAVKKNNLD